MPIAFFNIGIASFAFRSFRNADKLIEEDKKFMKAKQNCYKVLLDYMSGVLEYKHLTASMLEVSVE